MIHQVFDFALWLVLKGYVSAFLLGVITTLQFTIVKNARTLRANSATMRRRLEGDNRLTR